jgi:hypothetical protein
VEVEENRGSQEVGSLEVVRPAVEEACPAYREGRQSSAGVGAAEGTVDGRLDHLAAVLEAEEVSQMP